MVGLVVTFETPVPEDVYSALRTQGLARENLAERAQRLLALRFFQDRVLSLGQSARLAGMDRWRFIDFLAENDVPVLDFNEEELADEFAAVGQLVQQLRERIDVVAAKPIVVSDATPLIALAKIGQLFWLPDLFGEVLVPEAVYTEIVIAGAGRSGATQIEAADWIQLETIVDRMKVSYLLTQLDIGEAEAIVLAQEKQADWLLVDENKARAIAQRLGLQMIGTVGLLVLAKQRGKIHAVRPLLDELQRHQFRLSQKIYELVLKQSNER